MQWIIFELNSNNSNYKINNSQSARSTLLNYQRSQHAYFITIDIQQTDKLLTVQMRTLIMYC